MPQISVIIPVYNSEKYLRKCLDSLISQQFQDFEVLLVDDGSTDASMSVCQDYVKKDNRFKLLYQEHQGQSTARNYALKVAKGDRLAFIDGDDYVNDDYLSSLNSQMNKYQSDIATQPYYRYNPQKKEYGFLFHQNVNPEDYNGVYDATELILHLDLWKKLIGVSLDTFWGKLYKRSTFSDIWMPVGHLYGEDVLIAWKLFNNAEKISFENKAGYCWLIHPGELSTDSNSDRHISEAKLKAIQEEIATLAINGENVESLKNEYLHCLHLRAQQSLALGDFYDYEDTMFKLNAFNRANQK